MVAKRKKYLITTESHEVWVVRRNGVKAIRGFCLECEKEVEMMTLDSALNLSGISIRRLVHLAEKGEIHFRENEAGNMFLCDLSIKRFVNK